MATKLLVSFDVADTERKLKKIEKMLVGKGVKAEDVNDCLEMSTDESKGIVNVVIRIPEQGLTAAVQKFQKLANEGNVKSMNALGICYLQGHGGCPVDHSEAKQWFYKALEAGFTPARDNLANLFEKEAAEAKSIDEARGLLMRALQLYKQAVQEGSPTGSSQLKVGEITARLTSDDPRITPHHAQSPQNGAGAGGGKKKKSSRKTVRTKLEASTPEQLRQKLDEWVGNLKAKGFVFKVQNVVFDDAKCECTADFIMSQRKRPASAASVASTGSVGSAQAAGGEEGESSRDRSNAEAAGVTGSGSGTIPIPRRKLATGRLDAAPQQDNLKPPRGPRHSAGSQMTGIMPPPSLPLHRLRAADAVRQSAPTTGAAVSGVAAVEGILSDRSDGDSFDSYSQFSSPVHTWRSALSHSWNEDDDFDTFTQSSRSQPFLSATDDISSSEDEETMLDPFKR